MGGCCSYEISCGGKVIRHMDDREYGRQEREDIAYGDSGARIRLRGSSKFVSMYCQQGSKGINQDALTVWEGFTGEKGRIFCGVFDGHGPLGHKVSQYIRDNLPAKLSESIKMTQQKKVGKLCDPYPRDRSSYVNLSGENGQNMSLASWERTLVKSFNEMDEDVARDINTDSFSSGTTAVTVIQQGDQLIIANLGDSRAVLCTRGDDAELHPVQLTVDLKPDIPSEAMRIQNCEGRVFAAAEESQVYRIYMPDEDCPGLAMSRAFGDFCLKDYGLISVPDVFYRKITKQDEFVVLATDGIWDVLSNAEVISIVASAPRRSMAAKMLVRHAVSVWRYKYPNAKIDDCAVICLFLHEQPPLPDSLSTRSNVNKRKHLSTPASKPTRNDGTECSVDDGKSSVITLGQELDGRGRLSRANSVSNSKYPRLSRVVSRKSSQCVDGVEVP
ncbi:probable protein phosphatase 2C 65 [Neltuma alba]|uniref:probable protein phosphatase 2C 65 n=1 Tax=Neltuma alba TaxID=207710 RepID=UPI0010A45C67|nr:probable protein phosphatase 2C 65 [Prosopis alba]